jgi:hypothetical protein
MEMLDHAIPGTALKDSSIEAYGYCGPISAGWLSSTNRAIRDLPSFGGADHVAVATRNALGFILR